MSPISPLELLLTREKGHGPAGAELLTQPLHGLRGLRDFLHVNRTRGSPSLRKLLKLRPKPVVHRHALFVLPTTSCDVPQVGGSSSGAQGSQQGLQGRLEAIGQA